MSYDKNINMELKQLCRAKGFVVRGNALFRIHGDGVLQVVKVEKVRHFQAWEIRFGLFSMYGEMKPEWFTSSGCVLHYAVVNFENIDSAVYIEKVGDVYQGRIVELESQVAMFENKVMPFLDEINTQRQLATALCELDTMVYSQIRWNELIKFAPFLYARDYSSAEKVIQAILDQHSFAAERRRTTMSPEEFQAYLNKVKEEDIHLRKKIKLVRERNEADIDVYLSSNLTVNKDRGRFE